MFNISSNGIVTVNRGDSFELPLILNIGSAIDYQAYIPTDKDTVYVGVMEPNQPFETALIRKVATAEDVDKHGHVIVRFWPEDTECVLPGKYYYQVKLRTFDAAAQRYDVETIIDKTLFYIQE